MLIESWARPAGWLSQVAALPARMASWQGLLPSHRNEPAMNPHDREDLLRLVSMIEALELRDVAQVRARQQLLEKLRRYLREGQSAQRPWGRSAAPPADPPDPAPADRVALPVVPLSPGL